MKKTKYNRIILIGSPGAGKTMVAKILNKNYGLPLHYMDRLYFSPEWKSLPKKLTDEKLRKIIETDKWIIDQADIRVLNKHYGFADLIIFLDIKRYVCFAHVLKRRIECLFKEREETPDNSNNRIYPSFLLKVWRFPYTRNPQLLKFIEDNKHKVKIITLQKTNKKSMRKLLEDIG